METINRLVGDDDDDDLIMQFKNRYFKRHYHRHHHHHHHHKYGQETCICDKNNKRLFCKLANYHINSRYYYHHHQQHHDHDECSPPPPPPSPSLKVDTIKTKSYHFHTTTTLKKKKKIKSLSLILSIIVIILILISFRPQTVSSESSSYAMMMSPASTSNSGGGGVGGTQPYYMNSGQFTISQLCAGKSQFPVTKRIEGAVLSSNADADVNCTITFRTKSTQQHFVIRFEELKLGCDDHLKMFDSDLDYGQPSIKDFSCRDSLASVPTMKTTGTFLTIRFSSDSKTKPGDGFRFVATAVFDVPIWDCPPEYSLCRNQLCISKSLFCDDINHCIDNSDESSCSSRIGIGGGSSSSSFGAGSIFTGELTLTNALGLLVVLVFIIFACVIICIVAIYCKRESHYAQYQHHMQRAMGGGVPLQTSSSLMFANHQPQYHFFQPANMSPYVTPQHHAQTITTSTLPRGYSTLPLNIARQQHALQLQQQQQQQQQPQHQQQFVTKTSNGPEYLMMTGLAPAGAPAMTTTTLRAAAAPATVQTNLFLPTSQSILTSTGIRYSQPSQPIIDRR